MLTRKDIPRLLTSGLKTIFFNQYNAYTPVYKTITTEVPSTKSSEEYGWLGATPALREWLDERAAKGLRENGFTLKNKDYEATIAVDKNAFNDDQYGQIKVRVQQVAVAAARGYDKFLAKTIEANPICYDGQNFFDTDHPMDLEAGTTGTNVFTSKALTVANAKDLMVAMGQFTDENGDVYGSRASHIIVPTGLEFTAKAIFDPAFVGVSTDPSAAVLSGTAKVVVLPTLSSQTTYYIVDMTQGVSPFIFQNRQEMQFAALDNIDDIDVFMRKTLYYGVDARFAFGVGEWRLAIKASA